eukprot:CAMPEP_0177639640 /NCGR_PEP_ID=MMETSP0447-20121125/6127_1 /TAXON_ID=0 /ORGANISM="Stygamoeba regulata, Strain BSH-02190019" /LENGTH=481 /DNA_ID=CAMNT_0019141677 /DNA_START=12 /DNA_END=1454 /DNA_ORIENTATION=-
MPVRQRVLAAFPPTLPHLLASPGSASSLVQSLSISFFSTSASSVPWVGEKLTQPASLFSSFASHKRFLPLEEASFSPRPYTCSAAPESEPKELGQVPVELCPETSNVPPHILQQVSRRLHLQPQHPLNIVKRKLESFFRKPSLQASTGSPLPHAVFSTYDSFSPVVSLQQNFDDLLIPHDHVSRKRSETYYCDDLHVLRPHTSAHQTQLLRAGQSAFLVTGDCYRRDTIDASHNPIFHQTEGVRVFTREDLGYPKSDEEARKMVVQHMKATLESLVAHIFGADTPTRWVNEYFPFTDPSFELEIFFRDEWMEVLGCGAIHPQILQNCGLGDRFGWAFGQGIDRLAMVLFQIPDIRLFWSMDRRFLDQFAQVTEDDEQLPVFQPFSKYPPCPKDITFWLPSDRAYFENDFYELIRSVADDLIEEVVLLDDFVHPRSQRRSHCYRIVYRAMDRSLRNEEINELQESVRAAVVNELKVELRNTR